MGRRLVPTSTITRRMDAKDDRFSREQRRKFPHLFTPRLEAVVAPVVDVTLEPKPEQPIPSVVDVTIAPTRTSHLLQPGDLPTPLSSAERRRLTKGEADDVRRQLHVRPNEAHRREDFTPCTASKYFTHRFVANCWTTCEFCGKHYKDCLVKP